MTYHLGCSRTYPVTPAEAFDRVLPMPLPDLCPARYGPIPPVREVRDQDGQCGSAGVGQTRTIVLGDGGTMHETLVDLDRPHGLGYRLDPITGPLKPLATTILGRWAFDPAGTGVRITWIWEVEPRGRGPSARSASSGPPTPVGLSTGSSPCAGVSPRSTDDHRNPAANVTPRVVRRAWGCGAAGSAPRSQ